MSSISIIITTKSTLWGGRSPRSSTVGGGTGHKKQTALGYRRPVLTYMLSSEATRNLWKSDRASLSCLVEMRSLLGMGTVFLQENCLYYSRRLTMARAMAADSVPNVEGQRMSDGMQCDWVVYYLLV